VRRGDPFSLLPDGATFFFQVCESERALLFSIDVAVSISVPNPTPGTPLVRAPQLEAPFFSVKATTARRGGRFVAAADLLTLPRHPRDAAGRRTVLIWRNPVALNMARIALAPIAEPITHRALEIFGGLSGDAACRAVGGLGSENARMPPG